MIENLYAFLESPISKSSDMNWGTIIIIVILIAGLAYIGGDKR